MLYAHSLPGQPPEKWQYLSIHLSEVAELASRFADVFGASRLAFIIGWLHDLGKASEAGQKRIHGEGPKVDHSTAGARELIEQWEKKYGAEGKALAKLLAYCIVGHHGGLPDYGKTPLDLSTLLCRLDRQRLIPDYRSTLHELEMPDLKPDRIPVKTHPFSLAFFVRMLFSCLTDADWLNTEEFCNPKRFEKRKTEWTGIGDLAGKLEATLYSKKWMENQISERDISLVSFKKDTPQTVRINQARQAILSWCLKAAKSEPGLFSLTVPTGGGKTVSSLAFALNHAREHGLRRIIFVVPYTSIIEQNAKNIREWLGDCTVLEHHSNYIHPAERKTNEKNDEDNDQPDALEAQQFRLATENWEATVIVTTAVQFLESLFANKPSRCRKLHNIAKSVVIFDEAQMIPVPLLKPSVLAMYELVDHYGASLVFCTATQPALNKNDNNDPFPGFDPEKVREIIPDGKLKELFAIFNRVRLHHVGILSDTGLGSRLTNEKQVLCIVNTRKRAQEVFDVARETGKEDTWFHLSARMTPAHRSKVLDEIRKRLLSGQECHVVSTSLIECGVDISFPAVYREETGLDSIAQAAGRCNRNGELSEGGRFYVFSPECGQPKGAADLQRRATLFKDIFHRYADPFSPEAVEDYFCQLRRYANTDEADVVKKLCADSIESKQDFRFNFRMAAKAYRFIDSDMISVIVENALENNDEASFLVRRLDTFDDDPVVFRLLQQYTVQIYPWEAAILQRQGALEVARERFYILRGGIGYDKQCGLIVDDPTKMEAERGIF